MKPKRVDKRHELEDDVEKAIEEARQRVGDTFAELLTAPAMTQEEMDAVEGEEGSEGEGEGRGQDR